MPADDGGGEPQARFAFLAEASRLLAGSLDYETTLVSVAGLALPHLGAWCIVDLLEPDGSTRRLAVLHPDPDKQALASRLQRQYPPEPGDAFSVPSVVRMAGPEQDGPDAFLARTVADAEQLAILRELGAGPPLTVPMVARGRTVGAITFVATDPAHDLGPSDVLLAEDLASRCAMALDNARLYADVRAAREVAEKALGEARTAALQAAEVNERLVVATLREQELTEEAQEANRAKSEFLSTMSHEIRTPINAIIGYTDLLSLGIPGPVNNRQKKDLERIRASSDHLVMLIDDILDLAKVEAGRMQVEQESAPAAAAIAASIGLIAPRAAAGGVEIEYRGADGGGVFYLGDEQRVRQILVNLLSNAVKFTDPGGRVTVRCGTTDDPDPEANLRAPGRWTYFRVEDTGIGIPPDQTAAVFQPFVQVETGHTRTHDGTGLGLTIARELAVRMNGDLTLRSELGAGSCFTLWLPSSVQETAPPSG